MRVLINAVGADMGGAVRHLSNFLPALDARTDDHIYSVLLRPHLARAFNLKRVRILAAPESVFTSPLHRIWFDSVALPRECHNHDVLVSLTNFGPMRAPVPHVLYQRNALYYCREGVRVQPVLRRIDLMIRHFLLQPIMANAAALVVPSRSMGDLLTQSSSPLDRAKLRVLYHGFEASTDGAVASDVLARIEQSRGLRMFYPTHAAPHKGLSDLLRILAAARDRGIDFSFWSTIDPADDPSEVRKFELLTEELNLTDRVHSVGRVPQDQILALYRVMHIMIYPSLCESFGFSLVEAMGSGLPVLARDLPICREICGDAALYFKASDVSHTVKQIELLTDVSVRANLATSGRTRIAEFPGSWEHYATEFVRIVESVA